jgi:hypothetical protein
MAAVLRGFTIGLCWSVVGVGILAWMFYTGPLAGLSLLYVVGAGLFIVVAPFVHVGTFHLLGSDRLAVLITGVSMLVVLFVLAMTGMFNFT